MPGCSNVHHNRSIIQSGYAATVGQGAIQWFCSRKRQEAAQPEEGRIVVCDGPLRIIPAIVAEGDKSAMTITSEMTDHAED